jgi:Domain of unknown function (DUF1839)
MSLAGASPATLIGLEPATYKPHRLHGHDRVYTETNCYTDILIELVHALGHEPLAMLGCTLEVDFEGDQWTFFKPRPADLEGLYAIDIHEMQPYRPLPRQAAEQIAAGRTLIVELDSFHLPDTAATSYRNEHVKTSVAIEAIDSEAERMRYFHNAGFYELAGEDYRGVFHLDGAAAAVLPPYTELARFDAGTPLEGQGLLAAARTLLAASAARRPVTNPFFRFGTALGLELPRLMDGDAEDFHAYAFATVRMVGSAFEIGADHVEWVLGEEGAGAASSMREIVDGCKTLSFKLARRREFEAAPRIEALADSWDAAFAKLDDAL